MTAPLRFCFALHLHQPWGNFDSVFQDHLENVYRPLLQSLRTADLGPVAMHISGPLLEWLDANSPRFVDEIGEMASAGQLELLCAGHDEPILAVLSRQDRFEQVRSHREWIQRRFGVDAPGLWLTERVWEPSLPGDLAAAGVRFVLVDDRHFRVAGFTHDQLHSHYVTEAGGHRLSVFPIDEKLRYLIPFRPASELAEYFRSLRQAGHHLAVLGDDGEKFGGWPGTRKWLYDDGWLASFVSTMHSLRESDEVILSRFDAALEQAPAAGLAYLPSASYREMEGWSLPVEPARELLRLEKAWEGARIEGIDGGLLRGGHWRHFLVKYPESNLMHKFAMALSLLCRERGDPADARRAIGRAQCNDAYWHGVFGGLYLPFLRRENWANLARAEAILRRNASLEVESHDIDADGREELWVHSADISLLMSPARGGTIDLWLDLALHDNLLNVMMRHREAYHTPLNAPDLNHDAATGGAPSIHDLETQLEETPAADAERRGLFVDRVVHHTTSVADFILASVQCHRSWAQQEMSANVSLSDVIATIELSCPDLTKRLVVDDGAAPTLRCHWEWNCADFPADSWFTTELSFSAPLTIDAPGAERWEYPIETVAKSEKGFDRTVQGVAVVLRWPIAAGAASVSVSAG